MVHGFGEVLVGPRLEPGHDVLRVGHRRHEDDRDEHGILPFLEPPADFDAVDFRHHDVEQDQVGRRVPRCGERLLAVGGGDDLVSISRQTRPHDAKIGGVVIGDQDARRSPHRSPSA